MNHDKGLIETIDAEEIYTGPGIYETTMSDGSIYSFGYCPCFSVLKEKIEEMKRFYSEARD